MTEYLINIIIAEIFRILTLIYGVVTNKDIVGYVTTVVTHAMEWVVVLLLYPKEPQTRVQIVVRISIVFNKLTNVMIVRQTREDRV